MEIGRHSESAGVGPRSRNAGGWRAVIYILVNESFEKLASMSLIANMTVYLSEKYNLSGVFLTNVMNIWSGSTNLTSILGAVSSDAYIGRFHTLLWGTICSLLGMMAMTLTAAVPLLRPPRYTEPDGWQLTFLFISLASISLGAGGIRPCNIAFGADQFDTNTEEGKANLESFFNWWYFSFTIALMISLAGVVYVQTNISWVLGFAIPAACLVLSITVFVVGRPTYICKNPHPSLFLDLFKVIVAAYKKRKAIVQPDCDTYYDDGPVERDQALDSIQHDSCKWLNKAALITDRSSEVDAQGRAVDSWKLCSVRQVKTLKSLARILPVWVTGVGFFFEIDQKNTFGILQALQMDRSIGENFTIPPAWMGITSMISLSLSICVYERIYIPVAKKILRRESRLSLQHRITIGIIMSIVCMVVAGFVEIKRRSSALSGGSPMHVVALLPQYAISGLTEAFAAVALMEYFTLKLPQTMRSVSGAIFFLTMSIASYLSSLMVNIIHTVTGANGRRPWVGSSDLNTNKLDRYYFIIAFLGVINLFYFIFYARKFVDPPRNGVETEEVDLDADAGDSSR